MVLLRTQRLILREFEEADWTALHAVESLPEVARYQWFAPRTADESRAYVLGALRGAREQPRVTYDLAIVPASDDRPVGRVGLGVTDAAIGEGMLWYTLHPSVWGMGFATEAGRGLADFGFRELRLHRIWADCDPANVASWRVLEKIGMRREGHLRENARIKGAWADSLIYAILDREWV